MSPVSTGLLLRQECYPGCVEVNGLLNLLTSTFHSAATPSDMSRSQPSTVLETVLLQGPLANNWQVSPLQTSPYCAAVAELSLIKTHSDASGRHTSAIIPMNSERAVGTHIPSFTP